jgi:GAF domain-containing protein
MSENTCDALAETALLKRLLALPRVGALPDEIAEALRLLVTAMAATTGYLEIVDGDDPAPCFTTGHDVHGKDPAETICRGVIARSIAHNTIIESSSARVDARFRELGTVRRGRIEAIVCMPIEAGDVAGAVCIQRNARPGAFSECELRLVDYFVQQLAVVARRLAPTGPAPMRDEIRRLQKNLVREALARTNGNVAQAARELRVARSFVYSVVPRSRT